MNKKKRKLIGITACVLVCLLAFAACAPAAQLADNAPFASISRLFQ